MFTQKSNANKLAIAALAVSASFACAQGNHLNVFLIDLADSAMNQSSQQSVDLTPAAAERLTLDYSQTSFSGFTIEMSNTAHNAGFGLPVSADAVAPMESRNFKDIDPIGFADELFVVPLPSAVFAGMGMLVGIAGIRFTRSRK